jgi:hypothetical protein
MRHIRDQLKNDEGFRAFHEGRGKTLPEFYRRRFQQRLGPYAELISAQEMIPELSLHSGESTGGDGRGLGERFQAAK